MKKKILITGSTDGIGKLAAIKLAKDGHEIYLHGRNADKLSKVITEVKAAANNDKVKGFVADFSDLAAVKKMAQQIKQELSSLDVLINNAGVLKSPNAHNQEGFDMRFVVNYFAPYLLTKELLPTLQAGENSRIINLSSAAQSPVSLDALSVGAQLSEQTAYAQSKLALTMWSFYLAKKQSVVAVVAVNPGSLLNTNMVKEAYGRFWSSADKGANILYDLAVLEKFANASGKYFDNDQGGFGKAHGDAYNDDVIEKLIYETEEVLS